MSFSKGLGLPLVIVLALLGLGSSTTGPEEDLPNILWIVSEDNSPLLGCYGDAFATTPNLDQLASEGILYQNAFATAPVCAPTRFSLITGLYPPTAGTQGMRSSNPIPEFIRFFPEYLRNKGYYCTNNSKKDYNTVDQPDCWNESSRKATWKNRKAGQPFFHVQNFGVSHESSLHTTQEKLFHDPEKVPIPPYHPRTPEMKHDWAQYYDKVMEMDKQVGALLKELEADGLAENTIVFYYSDHGGVLGRSKRYLHESGTRVPLIIRFPEKYKHLAPATAGTKTDRIVQFIDFAPSVLSLAGIKPAGYMQGRAFLGPYAQAPRKYSYSFRDRMDEKMDMGRAVRDKQFRYIRNYLPYRPHMQYLTYLWRAPSMRSWDEACKAGDCNEIQQSFFEPKASEELYDVVQDPHNVNNLANDPAYRDKLEELRAANRNWALQIHDSGFLPEGTMNAMAKAAGITTFELVRQEDFPLQRLQSVAEMATLRQSEDLPELVRLLEDTHPVIRYWAATGILTLGADASGVKKAIRDLVQKETNDDVRAVCAEILYRLGDEETALNTLREVLKNEELMVRVRALNVLENIGKPANAIRSSLEAIAAKEAPGNANYDIRAAQNVLGLIDK